MKKIIGDIVNDVMVSLSRENEFTKDGYIKISDSILFSKYSFWLFILSSIFIYPYFPIRSIPVNDTVIIVNIILLIVIDLLLISNFVFRGRLFCTLYYKDDSIIVLNGFKHKMIKIRIEDIIDSNGYDGIKGLFRYMYFTIENTKERVYFNPNRNTETLINKIFREIKKSA